MTQPESMKRAIKLALRLEGFGQNEAAAELRRLHEVNQELLAALKLAEPLLQAMLNNIVRYLPQYEKMPALDQVRAAIAKGEQK
jgi:hypothetical protein